MISLLKRICVISALLPVLAGQAQIEPGATKAKKEQFSPGITFGGGGNFLLPNDGKLDDGTLFFKPSFTMQKSKHLLSLGPTFGIFRNKTNTSQFGGEFMYQYYPYTNSQTFSLYFFVDPAVSVYRHSYTSYNYYGYYGYGYNTSTYHYSVFLLKMAGGYGLRLNMSKWAYLYQHNEIGFAYSSTSSNDPYYSHYNEKPIYGFIQVSLGLGFTF
jgi:hypothetical protein